MQYLSVNVVLRFHEMFHETFLDSRFTDNTGSRPVRDWSQRLAFHSGNQRVTLLSAESRRVCNLLWEDSRNLLYYWLFHVWCMVKAVTSGGHKTVPFYVVIHL